MIYTSLSILYNTSTKGVGNTPGLLTHLYFVRIYVLLLGIYT